MLNPGRAAHDHAGNNFCLYFTEQHLRDIVTALDTIGRPVIEVTHGDGLGGLSFNYGFSLTEERKLMKAAVQSAKSSKIAALKVPGTGTMDNIHVIQEHRPVHRPSGYPLHRSRRVDAALRSCPPARVGDGRLPHDGPRPNTRSHRQASSHHGRRQLQLRLLRRLRGAMILEDVQHRVEAVVAELNSDAQVGFHSHDNLARW